MSGFFRLWVLSLAAAVAACGGGSGPASDTGTPSAQVRLGGALSAASQGKSALAALPAQATAAGVDAATAATQLLDFAERSYPDLFPGHPETRSFEGYLYRHYLATGIYLGVRAGQVYVMGGPFGTAPAGVGALTQFIEPSTTARANICADGSSAHAGWASLSPAVGKNVGLAVAACTSKVTAPVWRQTEGPPVSLVADKTQAISFEATAAGRYSFEVSFTDSRGAPQKQLLSVAVQAPASPPLLTVRASHAVRMGGKVSVRAWPKLPEGETVTRISWEQIDGPTVKLDANDKPLAVFTAPEVARDSLVRLRATVHTSKGRVDADEVVVLIEHFLQAQKDDADAMWAGEHVPRVYPYRPNGPYAGVLRKCVFDPELAYGARFNLCNLAVLPFLVGRPRTDVPSVEQVMERVLVSHDWLGRNFEQLLRTQDPNGDFRRMMASVTAIVISTQVRPSFYYPGTGAIYLDGESFWLTPEERDTLTEAPDYRAAFGDGLRYRTLWRYVLDGKSLFAFFDPELRETRKAIDVRNEAAPLLYHELGHALDFMPPSDYALWPSSQSAWEFMARRYQQRRLTSDTMPVNFPLRSIVMKNLAQVKFQGVTATETDRAYTPEQVGRAFSSDLAVDEYSYSTDREDVAMLVEEFMMSRRLGAQRDVAFVAPWTSEDTSASILVQWGQRGRIGKPALADRTRAVARELVPWMPADDVDRLPPAVDLRWGESWRANLGPPTAAALASGPRRQPTQAQRAQFQKELRLMQHHLHISGKRLPPLPGAPATPPN